jgi:hypothetical protein
MRSLHDACGINACVSVCMIQLEKRRTDLLETWYECYVLGDITRTFQCYIISSTNILDEGTCDMGPTLAHFL